VRIRSATPDDLSIIVEHRVAMFRDMGFADDVLHRIERVSSELLAKAIPTGGYHGVLAEMEGAEIVGGGGVLLVSWPGSQPRRCWIQNIYVKSEFRRKGVARLIMQELLEWCRGQGFDSVFLHASEEGRPLYEQLGFRSTNEMRLDFS
jgi:GNAT superfamily N-acetyltransferase